MIEEVLCRAFCDALVVTKVPVGYTVKTCFEADGGDTLTFYLVRSDETEKWRVEDDGATIANLDMAGVDVMAAGPRSVAFAELIQTHGVEFDPEGVILHTAYIEEGSLPHAALRFLSLLMRVQDFALITRERVEETFRHDVVVALREKFHGRAEVEEKHVFRDDLKDYQSDVSVLPREAAPLAVFLGTSEVRALEAMLFYDRVTYVHPFDCRVVLVLDTIKTPRISARTLNRVTNHFPIAAFRDDPSEAMSSLERQIFGLVQ